MIDHLSVTKIQMYLRCPAQLFFRYDEGIISPPNAALLVGGSFHSAHRYNFQQKVASKQDVPLEAVRDVFSSQFDAGSHDTLWHQDEDKGLLKDEGINVVSFYHVNKSPGIQPVEVEKEFNLKMQGLPGFKGFIDVVTEDHTLELKTTSRTPSAIEPEHILQATAYEAGLRVLGKGKGKVRVDYAVKKKNPDVKTFIQPIGDDQIIYLLRLIPQIVKSIEAGIAIPNRISNLCSDRWCGYWDLCHKRYGG